MEASLNSTVAPPLGRPARGTSSDSVDEAAGADGWQGVQVSRPSRWPLGHEIQADAGRVEGLAQAKPPARTADRAVRVLVAVSGVAAFSLYFYAARRSFTYDEANTIGTFVREGDLLRPFRTQAVFNNHPIFSFAETVIARISSSGEPWMRLLPALLGAGTVALFAWWSGRRLGWVAALAGSAVLATAPIFVVEVRQARGYALVVFCALVASILLVDDVDTPAGRIGYAAAIAVGVGTHLYVLLVVLAHIGYLIARRPLDRARLGGAAIGVGLGGLAYLGMWRSIIDSARARGHQYHHAFATDVTKGLLGRSAAPMVLLALLLVVAARDLLRRREILTALALPGVAVAGIWMVVRPTDLYPRFLIAAVLPVAAAVAWAVCRHRWLLPVAILASASALAAQHHDFQVEPPIREAAQLVAAARELGLRPCAMGYPAIGAYTEPPARFTDVAQVPDCDVVVQVNTFGDEIMDRLRSHYPQHWVFRNQKVVSAVPRSKLLHSFDGFG